MIKNAMPGEYKLGCNYYSNHRQDLTAGTTMWFTVTTNFGTRMSFIFIFFKLYFTIYIYVYYFETILIICVAEAVSNTTTLRLECNSTSPSTTVSNILVFIVIFKN